jgi:hypothetical protein
MFGNWWNDEPLMLTWGQGTYFVGGGATALKFLSEDASEYPGSGCSIPASQHIGRWSHFGQLQHLHFMTNMKRSESTAAQRVTATTNKALSWMKFAYSVATGELSPEVHLTEELEKQAGLPSIAVNHCVQDRQNVKIRTIFTLRDPSWSDRYRRALTPDVALGTMFHVLQDSFSPAHACRVKKPVNAGAYAVLVDIENYNEQVEGSHGELDGYPDWLEQIVSIGTHTYKNDPVVVGAWLLQAVDEKRPWKEVEDHLRNTIFASGDPSQLGSMCVGGQSKRK